MSPSEQFGTFLGAWLAVVVQIVTRAFVVMFVAAIVAKRFEWFAAIGYMESLAWSAGYDLVRGLIPGKKDE